MTGPAPSRRSEVTRVAARSRLFLSSYAALFVILAVRFDPLWLRLVCVGLAVVGVVDAWLITHRISHRLLPVSVTIAAVEDAGAEVGGYLASYLLPFVTVATPQGRDLVAYVLFLLVALVIYVRSDLVRVNPTFYLLGYRVVRITTSAGRSLYVVTRMDLVTGDRIDVADVAGIVVTVRKLDANA
jgi:hypothetical protein